MAQEKAWDEVNGQYAGSADEEPMTAFWSRKNYLRTAEDAEEQNDNNIDGIINNVSDEKERKKEHLLQEEAEQEEKESVRKKLQEERRQPPNPTGKEVVKEIGEERMKA